MQQTEVRSHIYKSKTYKKDDKRREILSQTKSTFLPLGQRTPSLCGFQPARRFARRALDSGTNGLGITEVLSRNGFTERRRREPPDGGVFLDRFRQRRQGRAPPDSVVYLNSVAFERAHNPSPTRRRTLVYNGNLPRCPPKRTRVRK